MTTALKNYLLSNVARNAGGEPGGGGAADGANKGDPWHKPFGFDDSQVRYLADKGIGSAADLPKLLKQTMDFEGIVRDRDLKNYIKRPAADKIHEWDGWKELGWKEKPEDYAFAALDDKAKKELGFEYDGALWDALRLSAHKHRVPLSAAQALHDDLLGVVKQRAMDLKAKGVADETALKTALRGEWKGDYDRKIEIGKRSAAALGIGIEDASELEKIIGAPRLAKLFATIGERLGEDFLRDGHGGGNGLPDSVEAIEAELRKLEGDDNWMRIFRDERHPQHGDYVRQRQSLIERIANAQSRAA